MPRSRDDQMLGNSSEAAHSAEGEAIPPAVFSKTWEMFLLVALTAAFVWNAGHAIGIDRYDETAYMRAARFISGQSYLTLQSWSPLYSNWYALLAHICPDPLFRYFLSWSLLVSFLVLLPPLVRLPGAWIFSVALLTLPTLTLGPYVSLFAACLLLTGMVAFLLRPPAILSDVSALSCLLCFVVAFVRPEYAYGVPLCASATLVTGLMERRSNDTPRSSGSVRLLLLGKLILVLGLSLVMHTVESMSAAENRSGVAFLQHFNVRAEAKGRLAPNEDPYTSTYAQRAFGLDPGPAFNAGRYNLTAYLRANPKLFAGHVLANLLDCRTLFLLLILVVAIVWPWLDHDLRHLRCASFYLCLVCLPSLAGIVVIFPRDHYANTLVASVALLLLQELRPQRFLALSLPWTLTVASAMLCAISISHWRLAMQPFENQRDELARVLCAREVDRTIERPGLLVLDADNSLVPYVKRPLIAAQPAAAQAASPSDLQVWIKARQPRWIADDDQLAARFKLTPAALKAILEDDLHYHAHACSAARDLNIYTAN